MIKRLFIIAIISVLLFMVASSHDARSLESLSYAVAIGIDKGSENLLRLSLQFSAPSSGNSRGSEVNNSHQQ